MIKILVGDDNLAFAKQAMPYIPNAEIVYLDDPAKVIEEALTGAYDIVVTDLQYTKDGEEGFGVLAATQHIKSRRVLWTGAAADPGVRARAAELGAEVLDKDELGALVGMAVSKKPLKTDGLVFIYASGKNSLVKAIEQVVHTMFDPGLIVVGSDLKSELMTGRYGLVIDTTTMKMPGGADGKALNGSVAHDMKYLDLPAVPRVVCVYSVSTVWADIVKAINKFLPAKG